MTSEPSLSDSHSTALSRAASAFGPAFATLDAAMLDARRQCIPLRAAYLASEFSTDIRFRGLLTRDAQGLFHASAPQEFAARQGSTASLWPDAPREGELPAGHRLEGGYVSYGSTAPAASLPAQEQIDLALASDFCDRIGYLHPAFSQPSPGTTVYLAVGDDVLLRYVSSGSAAERQLKAGLEPPSAILGNLLQLPAPLVAALGKRTLTPLALIHQVAAAGELSIVAGDAFWGPAQRIDANWAPAAAGIRTAQPRKGNPRSALSRSFVSFDEAVRHIHGQVGLKGRHRQQSLIVKHPHKDEFRATEPITVSGPLFEPIGLQELPAQVMLVGLYAQADPLPGQSPAREHWLYENTLRPHDLLAGLAQARHLRPQAGLPLPLCLGTADGALLSYQSRDSELELALFPAHGDWRQRAERFNRELLEARLSSSQWVRRLAEAGNLRVLVGSRLWNRPGIVLADSWQPFADLPVPELGPAFLSADDAARHAQEITLGGRARQMGGLIFQREDQAFVATQPRFSEGRLFDASQLYPTTETGIPAFPDGHRLHAVYRSNISLRDIDRSGPLASLPEDEFRLAHRRITGPEVLATIAGKSMGLQAFYVLMSDLNLIKYQPSDSPEEDALVVRLLPGARTGRSAIEEQLEKGELLPSDFIKLLAKAQGLYLVRGDRYWGKPGKLPAQWAPNPILVPSDRTAPALGPLFDDLEAATRHALQRLDNRHEKQRISFILKHRRLPRYVACEPLAAGTPAFSPASLFGTNALGDPDLPTDFTLAAIGYSAALYPEPLPATDNWQYRNFFTPTDLAAALPYLRPDDSPDVALPLYLSTREGAWLKYLSQDAQADALLLQRQDSEPSLGEQVSLGNLEVRYFVHGLARAGQLSVLRTSELWDREGPVSDSWKPYRHFQRRRLGPVFSRADDAARHAHGQIPHRHDQLHGGLVLQRPDGLFVATEPWLSPTAVFDHQLVFPREVKAAFFPENHKVVGVYHSGLGTIDFHLPEDEAELYLNLFRTWDIHQAIQERTSIPYRYFSGSDGSLIRYTASGSAHEQVLSRQLAPPTDRPLQVMDNALQRRIGSARADDKGVLPTYARDLLQAGELLVLVPSAIWTHKGAVSSLNATADGLRAGNSRQAHNHGHATAFPELSPVHIDAQDALRHALARAGQASGTLFGFIFKKAGREEYVSTAAVADAGSRFNRYRVFPEHVDLFKMIAQGYDFEGVYVAPPSQQDTSGLPADPTYRHFLAARDFAHLIATARGVCPVSQTPGLESSVNLYLSLPDGALLRYRVEVFPRQDETAEGAVFAADGIPTQGQLEDGSLTPLAYLHQVAATGRLSVLRSGTFWAARGPVTVAWDPARQAARGPERHEVGPLFSHADDAARYSHQRIDRRHQQPVVSATYRCQASQGYAVIEPFSHDRGVKVTRALAATRAQELDQERLSLTFDSTYDLYSLHFAHATGPTYLGQEHPAVLDFFSSSAICFATRTLENQGIYLGGLYLSTVDGALLRYTPRGSHAQTQLCATALSQQNGASGDHQVIELPDAAFVQKVAATGNLNVLLTSGQWRQPGPVQATWKPTASLPIRLSRAARALAPPLINSFHELGVGATDVIDPQRALPVLVGPLQLQPKDKIELYWGNHPDPVATHVQGGTPGSGHVTLKVETRWITSGTTTVRYVLTPFPGGTPEEGRQTVRVKLDIPGAPERSCKAGNGATLCENDKLAVPRVLPPGVIEDPEGVSVVVRRYANMARGDRIVVSWHGRHVQHPELMEPGDEVVVPIDPEIIRDAGNSDSIVVRYEIRDEVGNWSQWSPPALVEVGIGDPSLLAPVVPKAQGMLLNLDELDGADVQVLVLRYEGMNSGHTVRLVVEREDAEGQQLQPYTHSSPGHDSDPFVSFLVPHEQFIAILRGLARFYYHVDITGQPSRRSKSRPLWITGRARTLKPPRVPLAEQNGNVLDPAFNNVIALVEPYEFIAAGQQVKLIWLGRTASGSEVSYDRTVTLREEEIDRDIPFLIPDDKVSVLAGGSVTLHYEVTTSAGDSFPSLPRYLPVSAGPLDLPRPKVREAGDTFLLPELAQRGATVDVRYDGMRDSDNVQAYWRGTAGNGTPTLPAQPGSDTGSLAFFTPVTAVSANIGKSVEVGYTVTRGSVASPSEILPLSVLLPRNLPAPEVREARDRLLDLNTFSTDATVEVGKWPHIQVGQRVWLQVEGTRNDGTPYRFTLWKAEEITSISDVIHGQLPRSGLDSLRDLSGLTLTFKASFDGSADEATAVLFPRLTLTVRATMRVPELVLDTSPVNLHGQIFLIPCHPQVLPEFGPGTWVQRVPSGGVPGYTYSSENPQVAVVDQNGRVTVRSNGSTHIVVRDKAGQFRKYRVNVYGVMLCYDLGVANSDDTAENAAMKGLRLPEIDELKAIRRLYGNRWPLQHGTEKFTWSMTAKKATLGLILLVLDMRKPDVAEIPHPGLTVDLGLVTLTHHASGLGLGSRRLPCT